MNKNKLDLEKENVDQLNQEEEKNFKCIFCGETVGKHNWQTHIETNHADKISQEKVGNLTAFPSISQLNGTKANISNVPSKCALCNKIISCEENMKSHLEKVHGSKKPDDCEIKRPEKDIDKPNNKIINCEDNLKSHIEKVDESKKPDNSGNGNFHCDICNVEVINGDKLDRHMNGKKHIEKVLENEKLATGSVMAN